jgi:tetratricopeptide (TPR) repeat protein
MSQKLKSGIKKIQAYAWIFLCLLTAVLHPIDMMVFAEATAHPKATEELTTPEKQGMIQELMAEGDRYSDEKNYNLANAAYESVFLLDPENQDASARIDRLKKRMLKEGKLETELVTRVYDSEIDARVRTYLSQAKEFIKTGRMGQARLALQKLLLINPLHEEAGKLYQTLSREA